MADASSWVPEGVDITVPNAARIYDFALGGVHNLPVDREFFTALAATVPGIREVALANRAFLRRAVRWLAGEHGIDQFLDIGSGIPTVGSVHEVAREINPDARVVYADIDPVAVEHGRSLLRDDPHAHAIRGDLTDPDTTVFHREVAEHLDFSRPVGVLMVAVLHFVPDSADPKGKIARIAEALVPGSFLVLSHGGREPDGEKRDRQLAALTMYDRTPTPATIREPDQVVDLLGDAFELMDPGLVLADRWRPDPEQDTESLPQTMVYAAVARRR
ncbi:SAM-dependent methyltransferase [Actinoplanes sp. NPDC051851]|uniref:SAM-dependent methyltransferase n=1 Tax=Actinoplanes sp. NPDC051851 TaxID=3154753 RepID=UPI0034207E3F